MKIKIIEDGGLFIVKKKRFLWWLTDTYSTFIPSHMKIIAWFTTLEEAQEYVRIRYGISKKDLD